MAKAYGYYKEAPTPMFFICKYAKFLRTPILKNICTSRECVFNFEKWTATFS